MNSHNRDQEPIPALRLHRFGDIFSSSCYNIVVFSICALLLSTSKMKTVMEVIPMQIISLNNHDTIDVILIAAIVRKKCDVQKIQMEL